jgi:chromosome partitioning protein
MEIRAFISQKGGAGKSTLARQLACQAGEPIELNRAVLIDRDPQQTTAKWWARRQQRKPLPPPQPELLELGNNSLADALDVLRRQSGGVFVDTRPALGGIEQEAARLADQIIVPLRPSADDLEAIVDTLQMLQRLDALGRTVLVINAAKNSQRARGCMAVLSKYPVAVCPHHLHDRAAYQDASQGGLWVEELGHPGRAASDELLRVWAWLRQALKKGTIL